MKKRLGAKPYIFPLPVLIVSSYDENGNPDAMNVAYGGIVNSDRVQININEAHKTSDNIKANNAFTVGIADVDNLVGADYVGIVSGKDEADKVKKAGFTAVKSESVNAPVLEELPITLECEVEDISQHGQTLRIVGKIVDTVVDEEILDENGNVDSQKLKAISFDPARHDYLILGEKVGTAFSDGKKID